MTAVFDSVLVANRGEIALRVMRTAREMGYRVVAVFSEADRQSVHVAYADEAHCIGPAPAGDSYLNIDNLLAAAKLSGAQAIHPGYGFLAENAAFAQAVEDAGLVFIGPSPDAIALMGNKAAAKRRMLAANVPCVPGFEAENADDAQLLDAAKAIPLPLMVKAAAGGGGRGMVLVSDLAKLPEALRSARSVARNSFGSDELILEHAIARPRHVEIQVFADSHGAVVHLGERDCSVQRRHQKVLEEAPCPVMTQALRARMGAAAVEAARAIAYRGAGTVEFLLDAKGEFYFLEMNTRLQVEHPVTELLTGHDLVALQFRVARGEPLGFTQQQVAFHGHAMEVRLYAEEPAKKFLPRTGTVALWRAPEGVRVDAGIESGSVVGPHYDPMLAKIISWGETRDEARLKLLDALRNTVLFGVQTNRDFLVGLLAQQTFIDGQATTAFIEETYNVGDWPVSAGADNATAVAAVLLTVLERNAAQRAAVQVAGALLNWSSGAALVSRFCFKDSTVQVHPGPGDVFEVVAQGSESRLELLELNEHCATFRLHGRQINVWYYSPRPGEIHLSLAGHGAVLRNAYAFTQQVGAAAGCGRITAPMHGIVQALLVAKGDKVQRGQRLAVVEAMKMQHDILADTNGVISAVAVSTGDQVAANDLLLDIHREEG